MANKDCVLGLDFGTDSVRALIVDAGDGTEIATHVAEYPRWKTGAYCDPAAQRFRQHPRDHLEAMELAVAGALAAAPAGIATRIAGIGVDTTGSTPGPVDETGTALALRDDLADNPNAMFVLWKDHTAVDEADEINRLAHGGSFTDFTKYVGGIYSSEWFWAKALHVIRHDEAVRDAAFSWVEHCDWVTAVLAGAESPLTMPRSRCAAGHKAMWNAAFDGLPSDAFLTALDPLLTGLRSRLYHDTLTSDHTVGGLTAEWARRLGLDEGIPIAVGAFDAHMGGIGSGFGANTLAKVMGTSTCDMLMAPYDQVGDTLIKGICGQVDGSIVPGMVGMEAGQSAFGDVYAWYRDLLAWPLRRLPGGEAAVDGLLDALGEAAACVPPGKSGEIAVDWLNGRRTPGANQRLRGAIAGLHLGSDAPSVYRALIESTAFGARAIVDCFVEQGVPVNDVVGLGGIAKRSPLIMQISADVLNRPIGIVGSDQACALGAAMCAAVAAGLHADVPAAQAAMSSGIATTYEPNAGVVAIYDDLYGRYRELGGAIEAMIMDRKG